MKQTIRLLIILALVTSVLIGCIPWLRIDRHPSPDDYHSLNLNPTLPPPYDPNIPNTFQIDYRSADLSQLDLTNSLEAMLYADFDSQTVWPDPVHLPPGFDPKKILDANKNPGLGVQALHANGITGKGVTIAIIDQTLLVDHQEYKYNLEWYVETDSVGGGNAQMHGPAVASIAVGKTVGVAPDASLFYLADNKMDDLPHLAASIRQILAENQNLPSDHKIRVLSMSIGWLPGDPGYQDITNAVNDAKAAGIFVISVSLDDTYGWNLMGLGRSPLSNPDNFNVYIPGAWWKQNFFANPTSFSNTLLVPMDARTTASPTGVQDYAFYGVAGLSWTIPYLAGMYALALQVKPDLTPNQFWKAAMLTGRTTQIQHNGSTYSFGVILDPQALITYLKK